MDSGLHGMFALTPRHSAMQVLHLDIFRKNTPILTRKPSAFGIADLPGLWRVHWQLGDRTLVSTFYTQHDQACMLWGLISAAIFGIAQFLPVDWMMQAMFASLLTGMGVLGMVCLTQNWVRVEQLEWVLYTWAALMVVGLLVTDLSLFFHWGQVVIHLCSLWLGLTAIGYGCTAVGMRSRTFFLMGCIHLLGMLLLPYVGAWQCMATGIVIGGSTLLIAELQWDSDGACVGQATASK